MCLLQERSPVVEAVGVPPMAVCGRGHPSPSRVTWEVRNCVDVGPQQLLESVQGASVCGPVIPDRFGQGIKESGGLNCEAGFFDGFGFGTGFDCWFQNQSSFLGSSDAVYVALLRNQTFQDLPCQDDPVAFMSSLY